MSGSGGTRPIARPTPPPSAGPQVTAARPAGRRPAAAGQYRRTGRGAGLRLTGRGAVLVMLVVFFLGNLLAVAVQADWLNGVTYAAGSLLAVSYVRREALLLVVTTPPLAFFVALVGAELINAQGGTLLATAEGTVLTLATTSLWLLCCTALCLLVAWLRGLRQCIRDLTAELGGRAREPDGGPAL